MEFEHKPVSLQDIAERAGVDKSTVSKALRNHPKIALKTRDSLRELAREMGYQADPLLAKIATHRWKRAPSKIQASIAVLWSINGQWISDSTIAGAMEMRAAEYGYTINTIALPNFQNKAALSKSLYHRGIEGIIIGPLSDLAMIDSFDFSPFPTISVLSGNFPTAFNTVRPNLVEAVRKAFQLLIEAGCKRPGLIVFEPADSIDEIYRMGAFLFEQQRCLAPENQIPVLKLTYPDADQSFGDHNRSLLTTWQTRHRPDGVIGMNNLIYWWLQDIGCKFPETLSFISLTLDDPPSGLIAGFSVPWAGIGRIAVDSLQTIIRTGQRGVPEKSIQSFVTMHYCQGNSLPSGSGRLDSGSLPGAEI